jgi:polysaccharide pyruvyl transferase WcaK-like protein
MMLLCLRRWLEAQDVSVSVLSENPRQVEAEHGLPAIRNWPLLGEWSWRGAWLKGGALEVLRAIAHHDVLIVGGGDLVRDDLGWRGFFFPMEKVFAALLQRKKVYFVNVGLGRPRTAYGKRLLKRTLPLAEQIIVRDRRSIDVCRECGVAADRVVLAPDIVTTLRRFFTPETVKPYVIVALREAPDTFGGCRMTRGRIRRLAGMLDAVVERDDVDVIFVPFQSGEIDDARIHRQVASAMRHQARAMSREWTNDFDAVLRLFANARGVLAMRLHAAVLAATYVRPCLVLPYDHKLREFASLTGVPCLEPGALDAGSSPPAIVDWLQHQPAIPTSNAAGINGSDDDVPMADWESLRLTSAPPNPAAHPHFVNSRLTKETTP